MKLKTLPFFSFILFYFLMTCGFRNTARAQIDSIRITTAGAVRPLFTSSTLSSGAPQTLQLSAEVFPLYLNQNVTWTFSSQSTAFGSIDATGLLTIPPQTSGTIWIEVTSSQDPSYIARFQVLVYCRPSHTNPISWFVIDTVRIAGTSLDNPSSLVGSAYNFFPEDLHTTTVLNRGGTYQLESHVSASLGSFPNTNGYSYSLHIDYNRNGIFENNEWTEITSSTTNPFVSQSFTIPSTADTGFTLLRVRTRIEGGLNGAGDACLSINGSGQTQDYIVHLTEPSAICLPADPGLVTGDIGCVAFTYAGQQVHYATVRAADGNIWLQQNLGGDIAAAPDDPDAFGDVFQWGRWDDGHQFRGSAVIPPLAINDPSGLGPGINAFFSGTTPGWWGNASLTDTWTAEVPSGVSATNGCDPCKAIGNGWRLPSEAEWISVVSAENINSPASAYNSHLKLTTGGVRNSSGTYDFAGIRGYYWSSTTSTTGAKYLYYSAAITNPSAGGPRRQGASVRCLKTAGTLSRQLIRLEGTPTAAGNILVWETEASRDIQQFTLERSTDGNIFIPVSQTIPANHSNYYSYADRDAQTGTCYYRLRILSLSGIVTYSSSIQLTRAGSRALNLRVTPNPFRDRLSVEVKDATGKHIQIRIGDLQGKILREETVIAREEGITVTFSSLENLATGVYLLIIQDEDGQKETIRLIH